MGKIKIVIAGDIVPTTSNYEIFEAGKTEDLLGERLAGIWNGADIRIANLEAPMIDQGIPIQKSGPNLSIPTKCINGFKALGISLFGLANNHIMDYGETGLRNTIDILRNHDIKYCGAGMNNRLAEKGEIVDANGIKIGIYACSEHEFSAAKRDKPGANAIDITTCLQIYELKRKTDFLIVLFHGGKEHYRYPTPEQQDRFQSFVDAGADLVICQHSHCIGCEEKYSDSIIVYGQGNFIFDYKDIECWKTGLLIEAEAETGENKKIRIMYHPVEKNGAVIQYAKKADQIIHQFEERNKKISRVNEFYLEEVKRDGANLTRRLLGWNRILRGIDRFILKDMLIKLCVKRKSLAILGITKCETNREIAECYMEDCL